MTTPTPTRTARQRLLDLVTAATARLADAWGILTSAQTALLNALSRFRTSSRIRAATNDFNQAVAEYQRQATAIAESWAATDLPVIYRDAALRAIADFNRTWSWTASHQATITVLTAGYYGDLMRRITEAVRRAQEFSREAQDAARTAEGIDADALLDQHPLGTVIYANRSRHPVPAWAGSALAWQAVTTANTASARTALDDLGADWLEVRDGNGCGWTEHTDPDTANGSLRTVQDALAHPAAHPHCQREFLPRPDIRLGDFV